MEHIGKRFTHSGATVLEHTLGLNIEQTICNGDRFIILNMAEYILMMTEHCQKEFGRVVTIARSAQIHDLRDREEDQTRISNPEEVLKTSSKILQVFLRLKQLNMDFLR